MLFADINKASQPFLVNADLYTPRLQFTMLPKCLARAKAEMSFFRPEMSSSLIQSSVYPWCYNLNSTNIANIFNLDFLYQKYYSSESRLHNLFVIFELFYPCYIYDGRSYCISVDFITRIGNGRGRSSMAVGCGVCRDLLQNVWRSNLK